MSQSDDETTIMSAGSSSGSSSPSSPSLEFKRPQEVEDEIREILQGLTTSLPFTPNALKVVSRRYLKRTLEGKPLETPEQMFRRVSRAIAAVEYRYSAGDEEVSELSVAFYDMMSKFKFTPAGRTLANAGAETRLVANCVVLHIGDSMKDIFQTLSDAALLQQAGSGLGFPLHLMRPAGTVTKRSKGISSGPISFLNVFNTAFGVIKQDNRNGANMGVMRVDHPDILEFIHCKDKEGDLANFNVSVGITDRFMQELADDCQDPWVCEFEGKNYFPRVISRDRNFTILDIKPVQLTARQIFMQIVDSAWKTGEPGCVFIDTVNAANPVPGLGRIEACNPCGEQFLHDGDVCNLGSLNLDKFVTSDEYGNAKVDYDSLRECVKLAVRMLDNVIDESEYDVQRVKKTAMDNRRIGLGIMGFADMLYQLRVGYDTCDGREIARSVMKCIDVTAHETSMRLGLEKGVFPNWSKSIYAQSKTLMRNAALTNIAPTGTIAMMFDVSGGVEPYFALAYNYQNVLGGNVDLCYFNKHLEAALKEAGCYTKEVLEQIRKRGTLQNIDSLPDWIKETFVTSMDISAEDHILMQAAMQENCDNAISKTVNFPNSATREDIVEGYVTAWRHKCKGCTVYRDGSRTYQVLNLNDSEATDEIVETLEATPIRSEYDGRVREDIDLQVKNDVKSLIKSVSEIGGTVLSQRVRIEEMLKNAETLASDLSVRRALNEKKRTTCPDCSSTLIHQEGCASCRDCGYSACSRS